MKQFYFLFNAVIFLFLFSSSVVSSSLLERNNLAPNSSISDINPFPVIVAEHFLRSNSDLVVVAANRWARLFPDEDYKSLKKQGLTKILFRGLGNGSDLDAYLQAKGNKEELNLDLLPSGEMYSDGWRKNQHLVYLPMEPREVDYFFIRDQNQRMEKHLENVFEWAKRNGKKTITVPPIGVQVYNWNIIDVYNMLYKIKIKTGFKGSVHIAVDPSDRASILKLESHLNKLKNGEINLDEESFEEEDLLSVSPEGQIFKYRLVNREGIKYAHARMLYDYFRKKRIIVKGIKKYNRDGILNDKFIVVNSSEIYRKNSWITNPGPSKIMNHFRVNEDIEFDLIIPSDLEASQVDSDLFTLFTDEFVKLGKSIKEKAKNSGHSVTPPSLSFSIDYYIGGQKILVHPRFAEIIKPENSTDLPQHFPIIRHYPRDPEIEKERFLLIAKRAAFEMDPSKDPDFTGNMPVFNRNLFELLVEEAVAQMEKNPEINAEYAVYQAYKKLVNTKIDGIRKTASGISSSITISNAVDYTVLFEHYAIRLVSLIRSPFFYGFHPPLNSTRANLMEAAHFRSILSFGQNHGNWFKKAIPHVEKDSAESAKIEKFVSSILEELTLAKRDNQIFPWASFSELMEEKFKSDKYSENFQFKLRLIAKMHQLYWLGYSFLSHPYFDTKKLVFSIKKTDFYKSDPDIRLLVLRFQKTHRGSECNALELYELMMSMIKPHLDGEEFVAILNETELSKALRILERARQTVLIANEFDNTALQILSRGLNVVGVIYKEDVSPSELKSTMDIFPGARVGKIVKGAKDVPRTIFEGIVSEPDRQLIINPSQEQLDFFQSYKKLYDELREMEGLEVPGSLITKDGFKFPFFGHTETRINEIGRIVHLGKIYEPRPEAEIIEPQINDFLERHLKTTPPNEPLLIQIFQNRTSSPEGVRQYDHIKENDINEIISTQMQAIKKFSKEHPDREFILIPQSEAPHAHYKEKGGLLEQYEKLFHLESARTRVTLIRHIVTPSDSAFGETVYVNLNHIHNVTGSVKITPKLIRYLHNLLLRKRIKRLFIAGDVISTPAGALLVEGLNLLRMKEKLPPAIIAPRDGTHKFLQSIFSQVNSFELKKQVSVLVSKLKIRRKNSESIIRMFSEWAESKENPLKIYWEHFPQSYSA